MFSMFNFQCLSASLICDCFQGRFYVGAGEHLPPGFTYCPQIQKLADHSDVISEVPKCSKIQIFPLGSLQRSPRPSSWWGGNSLSPLKKLTPPFGPRFFLRVSRSNPLQSCWHYQWQISNVGLYEVRIFRYRRTEKMDSVMKGLMGEFWG